MMRDVLAFLTPVVTAYVGYKLAVLTKQGDKKAKKDEEVAAKLEMATTIADQKLDALTLNGEKVHTLVNSAMGAKLLDLAKTKRQFADFLKAANDPRADEAEAAAVIAETVLGDHERKQKIVDRAAGLEALRKAQQPLPPETS